ncbi:succinate dehydrogenase/fumarate reductase flavoprotein subunit [Paenibacillus cellulosilyticus]|uniref:Succinate dehydrogenase/fumarate reductase flavoprotein subunit n=1 Tax=Paenibacillus cellulosilyticus TaxID=375489 RepID=A0A2V2YRC9_9BACL|nr:FAD-binding protein [Paenibacillus cellulosilyticus]PWV99470.1 succinate dehydrogenase/fumarate reductase flavoprotein subunit [Paenibacillus cellulosilyticus]QKS44726.1 FAD-binding protein [Paenibacillus cellulosilyticus]
MGNAAIQSDVERIADVLVIGGGPAGTWAALTAAAQGASVVLVDKGYCGTSGATAPSGTGVWYVEPTEEQQEAAMKSREALGGYLADRGWMKRVLNQTYANMNDLALAGYPYSLDDEGQSYRRSLQGPEYMRLMRKRVKKAGVIIMDHSPALELLADEHGVGGASGVRTETGETWTVKAGAVVIASGGCAFLSKALGCNVLTGDGYLIAAEAGASLSGMEFSNAYGISPTFATVTKTAFYTWATFYYEDGSIIEGAGSQQGRSVIAHTLKTQPVYARLDRATEEMQRWMRAAQPNFFLPFDRLGIDPFTQMFPVTLRLEGTVRGTGGIHLIDESCASAVPGLYAAGDAATRQFICGGFTGGGSHNAAWAMSSGYWAGEAASAYATGLGSRSDRRELKGVSAQGSVSALASTDDVSEWVAAVKREVEPFDINLFRTEATLNQSLGRLNSLWRKVQHALAANAADAVRLREAQAMTATARWMYASALARRESRGMHKRLDYPGTDDAQHYRILTGGLNEVWVKPEAALHRTTEVHER